MFYIPPAYPIVLIIIGLLYVYRRKKRSSRPIIQPVVTAPQMGSEMTPQEEPAEQTRAAIPQKITVMDSPVEQVSSETTTNELKEVVLTDSPTEPAAKSSKKTTSKKTTSTKRKPAAKQASKKPKAVTKASQKSRSKRPASPDKT